MTHYSDDTPLGETYTIRVMSRGTTLQLASAAGMFSKDELDTGTKLLLESCSLPERGRVLDLGCGIGVIGLFVKTWLPHLMVVQSDVTQKAITLTTLNAKTLALDTRVVQSDCYDALPGEVFDAILVNPPRAAGKAIIEKMIREAPTHLMKQGNLQLVALTNKGGKSYEAMMQETFGNVETTSRGSGFKIYRSTRAS